MQSPIDPSHSEEWLSFPELPTTHVLEPFDRTWYRERLQKDAPRLLSDSKVEIDVFFRDWTSSTCSITKIVDQDSTDAALHSCICDNSDTLFILKQDHTWSRLLASIGIITKILSCYNVFPPFLDILHKFGLKTTETAEQQYHFDSLRHCRANEEDCTSYSVDTASLEFCYTVPYMAENGRDPEAPWSLRQTGIYEQWNIKRRRRIWIIIQPSIGFVDRLRQFISLPMRREMDSATLHLSLLLPTKSGWGGFLDWLEVELSAMEQKALFCSVGKVRKVDFSVTFADSQNVQFLRKKLLQLDLLLWSSLEVCKGFQEQLNYSNELISHQHYPFDNLRHHVRYLQSFQERAATSLKRATGVLEQYFQILQYRNEEALQSSNEKIQRHSVDISTLSMLSNQESRNLNKVAEKTMNDSRVMKTLTLMASLYLPANLVAAVFNSNLIELDKSGSGKGVATRFIATSQFWMFPLFTIILTAITFVPTLLITRGLWFTR